jgi:type II secretory pathway pseudopilin PulG
MTIRRALTIRGGKPAGFCMIEVIIVLLVLGSLGILILNSLQIVQAKSRDSTRRSDIDNIAQKLEACYNDKDKCSGSYPSLAQLTDTSPTGFVGTSLTGFNNGWLSDSSAGLVQSGDATAATQYQHQTAPTNCTGTGGDIPCQGFTLRAYQETNPEHPYVKESLNK